MPPPPSTAGLRQQPLPKLLGRHRKEVNPVIPLEALLAERVLARVAIIAERQRIAVTGLALGSGISPVACVRGDAPTLRSSQTAALTPLLSQPREILGDQPAGLRFREHRPLA